MSERRTGLVLEGGAMRGMFTAGVLDVWMEAGITFDGAIGTSAGAVFGCNLKSRQIGRVIRYNKKYCADERYVSWKSLLTTGDLYNEDFCYHELPSHLDPFDTETFRTNPMEFYVTCTDVETGKAVYHKCTDGGETDIRWMQASASMPIVSKIVEVDGYRLMDGGVADSIPIRKLEELGFDRNVVVLTQPLGFMKFRNKAQPLVKALYRKYPRFLKAFEHRPIEYNKTTSYIRRKEQGGDLFVVRPPKKLAIGSMEKDPAELERVYQIGRTTGEAVLEDLRHYLEGQNYGR